MIVVPSWASVEDARNIVGRLCAVVAKLTKAVEIFNLMKMSLVFRAVSDECIVRWVDGIRD